MSGDYDLSAVMTWNLCSKYSPLTMVLICPVMSYYINYYGSNDLKMSKISRQLTFLYKKFSSNDLGGTPSIHVGVMGYYINYYGSYDLKMSKMGRQLTFLYKKCPNSDIRGAPSIHVGVPFSSVLQVLFIIFFFGNYDLKMSKIGRQLNVKCTLSE